MKVGDVVRLKSGGPWMTVSEIRADGIFQAEWWCLGLYLSSAFDPAELTIRRWWMR